MEQLSGSRVEQLLAPLAERVQQLLASRDKLLLEMDNMANMINRQVPTMW